MKQGVFKNSDNTAYYNNNQLHRADGPAVEWDNGSKHWYFHGLLHRTDGPAIYLVAPYLGYTIKKWSINGKWHREDGPAVEWGTGYKEWWIDGQQLTEDQFNQWLKDQAVGETFSKMPLRDSC